MQTGYIEQNMIAGFVTRGGADIKSITATAAICARIGVLAVAVRHLGIGGDLTEGHVDVGAVLESTDGLDAMIGVVVRFHDGWTLQVFPQEIGVLSTGYIQVPAAASITPKRNQAVYYDATNKVFTTDNTKVPIRAVFAANGIADGCAEIQVTQQVVIPVKSSS